MTAQPDIIWNEQCLGIRIGEQVCTYLKKHDAEYQRLQNKILELTERYPVIETFMESRGQAIPAGPLDGDGGGPDGAGLDG